MDPQPLAELAEALEEDSGRDPEPIRYVVSDLATGAPVSFPFIFHDHENTSG